MPAAARTRPCVRRATITRPSSSAGAALRAVHQGPPAAAQGDQRTGEIAGAPACPTGRRSRGAGASPPGRGRTAHAEEPESGSAQSPIALVEFPADDPDRALRFWSQLWTSSSSARRGRGRRVAIRSTIPPIGVHVAGVAPETRTPRRISGSTISRGRLEQVSPSAEASSTRASNGRYARTPEGSPFGLAG